MEQLKFEIKTINGWNLLDEGDYEFLKEYNEKELDKPKEKRNEIKNYLLPEPFIGNPNQAKVIFLAFNPGYAGDEDDWHIKHHSFPKLIKANLNQSSVKYPYYYLNPAKEFEDTPGHKWSKIIFKELINKSVSIEKLTQNIACFQYFGYHSLSKKVFPKLLPSQNKVFTWLANRLTEDNPPLIVIMRSKKEWYKIEGLEKYTNKIFLTNYRRPYISQGNIKIEGITNSKEIETAQKDIFDKIISLVNS